MKNKFIYWDNAPKEKGGQRIIDWEEIDQLDTDGLIMLCDVLKTQDDPNLIPLQYTGAIDRNKKEVYERSVVKDGGGSTLGLIVWDENLCGFYIAWDFQDTYSPLTKNNCQYYENIGIVFEYPELMEKWSEYL